MAKPGFIKPKGWDKYFSKKETEELFDFFIGFHPNVNWEEQSYKDVLGVNRFTPIYPETNKYDDSEGIKPKQVKAFVDLFSMEDFKKTATFLSIHGATIPGRWFVTDKEPESPTFISWKTLWESNVATLSTKEELGHLFLTLLKNAGQIDRTDYYVYANDVKQALYENTEDILALLNEAFTNKLYPKGETLNLKKLSLEDFIKEREDLWMKTHKVVPHAREMLFMDPTHWDKDIFTSSLDMFFGVKQLTKLSQQDKEKFLKLYKTFGFALPAVGHYLKRFQPLETVNLLKTVELIPMLTEEKVSGFKKVLAEMTRGIQIIASADELINILMTFIYFQDTTTEIQKKADSHAILLRDIDSLKETGAFVTQLVNDGESLKFLDGINFRDLGVFKKYPFSQPEIKKAIELYKKTHHIKTTVPLFKGSIDNYEFEMIDKNDIRGLAAGNATQCCQRMGGVGETCVYFGQEKENSTFFLITKNGEICAQSWVWMIDGQITFDSFEMKGDSGNQIKLFVECYKEYAKYAIKQKGVKLLTVGGGRGSQFTSAPMNGGDYIRVKEKHPSVYSDASTQYLLLKK